MSAPVLFQTYAYIRACAEFGSNKKGRFRSPFYSFYNSNHPALNCNKYILPREKKPGASLLFKPPAVAYRMGQF